jgi:hypothetical protein
MQKTAGAGLITSRKIQRTASSACTSTKWIQLGAPSSYQVSALSSAKLKKNHCLSSSSSSSLPPYSISPIDCPGDVFVAVVVVVTCFVG